VSEKAIVEAIKKALTKRGAWVIKTHGSPHLAGVPDLLVCYNGHFVALEVKQPHTRDTVTRRQQHFLDAIEAAGGFGRVVTSVEEALDVIQWL
jgi:Holliday junction resolvase